MDDLQRLLHERAIERLITDYVALNDDAQWEALADSYVEDGRMSRPTAPDDFIEGRAAILEAFQARPPRKSRHIVANIRVDLVGEQEAQATSQILLFTAADQAPKVGTYQDRLRYEGGRWKFVERRGSLDF